MRVAAIEPPTPPPACKAGWGAWFGEVGCKRVCVKKLSASHSHAVPRAWQQRPHPTAGGRRRRRGAQHKAPSVGPTQTSRAHPSACGPDAAAGAGCPWHPTQGPIGGHPGDSVRCAQATTAPTLRRATDPECHLRRMLSVALGAPPCPRPRPRPHQDPPVSPSPMRAVSPAPTVPPRPSQPSQHR